METIEEEGEAEKVKSKPPKKPKLTKEEKRLLKLKHKLEFEKKLIRDEYNREAAMIEKSMKRGLQEWSRRCQEIKMSELRFDVENWAARAERIYNLKKTIIERKFEEFDVNREMQYRSFAKHADLMTYLQASFKAIRGILQDVYNSRAQDIVDDMYIECNERQRISKLNCDHCESIIHVAKSFAEYENPRSEEDYLARKLGVVDSEIYKRYELRDRILAKMNELQNQMNSFVQPLMEYFGDPVKQLQRENQKFRSVQLNEDLLKGNREEKKARALLDSLRRDLQREELSSQQELRALKAEQTILVKVRKNMQDDVDNDNNICIDLIRFVGLESRTLLKKLIEIQTYGEHLLSLAECCRKHQTEKEKILPWGMKDEFQSDNSIESLKLDTFDSRKYLNLSDEQFAEEMTIMGNFWKRLSLVKAQNFTLLEEKRKLTEQNEKYRNIIRAMGKRADDQKLIETIKVKQLFTDPKDLEKPIEPIRVTPITECSGCSK